ncbi:DUF3592 domain-containing protein [Frankia sp. AgB32]|uniref:DUF3592 domain-containing protein n=1 Tax=Frankia sp. AgB32 TaxID=631119 RepID=UPI00200D422D|nr:DUF3592 domain-containing protein [Frankia sp. AgB32]MCK9895983.1 hypothetical protein [Frankia sp. AgB32]
MRRRRGRLSGAVLGGAFGLLAEVLFAVVWMGSAVFFLYAAGHGLADDLRLRAAGVRVSALALHARAERITTTDSDGSTSTSTRHFTTVRFRDDVGTTREVEIDGYHPSGRAVSVIYLRHRPETARPASAAGAGHLVLDAFEIVFALSFVLFGLAFFRAWFAGPW